LCRTTGTSFATFGSRIEELVSLAKDEDSATQKTKKGNAENDAQSGNAGLLNRRHERRYLVSD